MRAAYASINASKANFDDIYVQNDPRAYFAALGALDYMIPDLAAPIVKQLLSSRLRGRDAQLTVLDIGCSYGINAALHRHPLDFQTLRRRYTRREIAQLSTTQLARLDRNYYASWPDVGQARFIGLDRSAPAIEYACDVGLHEAGIAADLENESLTDEQRELVQRADVMLSTGCIGYVTERTYRQLLAATRAPWIISFVLRMFPFDPLTRLFADHGLVTERLAGMTFIQRRFRDEHEFAHTLRVLSDLGIPSDGIESQGMFHAELFVSRPEADVRAAPLPTIVTACSGQQRPVGMRYVLVGRSDHATIVVEP
jgi:SAM-dependent methyltransferase